MEFNGTIVVVAIRDCSGRARANVLRSDATGSRLREILPLTVPALLLTTTGRKSGEKFIFPLYYGADGDRYFVIVSKGGAPQHPGWYRNILANPDVEVQVGTKKLKARARTATGDERIRVWKKALEFWPPTATINSRPNARYRWSCWTLSTNCRSPSSASLTPTASAGLSRTSSTSCAPCAAPA